MASGKARKQEGRQEGYEKKTVHFNCNHKSAPAVQLFTVMRPCQSTLERVKSSSSIAHATELHLI
jgi:hypothetical protein